MMRGFSKKREIKSFPKFQRKRKREMKEIGKRRKKIKPYFKIE